MRIIGRDQQSNGIKVMPETDEDLWHLYNVLEEGDTVTASTTRREEKAADKIRAERTEKKRMTLGVRIEKVDFSEEDLRLKLLGIIESGPQDIGQHHTLMIEPGDSLIVSKQKWRATQVERLERAVRDTNKPRIVFVSLDQDEATVAVLRQYGLKEIAFIRSGRSGKQYDEKRRGPDGYHEEVISKVRACAEKDMPVVLLGPGFEKELLAETGKSSDPDLFSRCYVYHTGQCGMAGINELMKAGMGAEVLRESTVGAEMEAVERLMTEIARDGPATYGQAEVSAAASAGAVETLLVLDSKVREQDLDSVVRDVESQRGSILVISSQHDAGKRLAALGGIGAILRYAV
jgi:protein pelota